MRNRVIACVLLAIAAATLAAQPAPKLPAETLLDRAVLEGARRGAVRRRRQGSRRRGSTQLHRVPASPGFHEAIEYVMGRAKAVGLSDVHVETFPGDGTTWFGTLHGNRGWRVDGGSLDEVQPQPRRIISYDDVRLAVADNSESADVTVELVDVGARHRSGATTTARTCAASWCCATRRRPRAIARRSRSSAPPASSATTRTR